MVFVLLTKCSLQVCYCYRYSCYFFRQCKFGKRRVGDEKTVNKYITTTTLARQKTPVLKG